MSQSDLDILLNEESDTEEATEQASAGTDGNANDANATSNTANENATNTNSANGSPNSANGNSNGANGTNGNGPRLPALRLVLSAGGAGGASLTLERPSWTLYRAVLALNARLPAHDTHRDTTYTLVFIASHLAYVSTEPVCYAANMT